MKRIISALLLLFLLTSLFSCGKGNDVPTQATEEKFSPLFRFTVSEGKSAMTRLFYLPKSEGFLYLHPDENGGFTGGFVSPGRSVSSEAIVKSNADLESVLVWEDSKDRAHLLTEKELFTLLLKENGSHTTALPEDFVLQDPLPLDTLSFINETNGLLLIHPIDFKETYVLAQSARLPDFAELILPGDGGKKIWYARSDKDAYKGIGFFEYGANLPLGNEDFPFDSFTRVGSASVLFTRILEEGGALYLYRNLDSGETKSFLSDKVYEGVSCDPNGKILCGTLSAGEGGSVTVIDLEKGVKKGEYSIDYGTPAPSLALSDDAKTLLIAVGKGHDEVLGTLDLTQF